MRCVLGTWYDASRLVLGDRAYQRTRTPTIVTEGTVNIRCAVLCVVCMSKCHAIASCGMTSQLDTRHRSLVQVIATNARHSKPGHNVAYDSHCNSTDQYAMTPDITDLELIRTQSVHLYVFLIAVQLVGFVPAYDP